MHIISSFQLGSSQEDVAAASDTGMDCPLDDDNSQDNASGTSTPTVIVQEPFGDTSKPKGKGKGKSSSSNSSLHESDLMQRQAAFAESMRDRVTGAMTEALNKPPPKPNEAFGQYLASVSSDLHTSVQSGWRSEVSTILNYETHKLYKLLTADSNKTL